MNHQHDEILARERPTGRRTISWLLAALFALAAPAAPNVMIPPMWVRVAMMAMTPPGMIAGAYVRGQARIIREQS